MTPLQSHRPLRRALHTALRTGVVALVVFCSTALATLPPAARSARHAQAGQAALSVRSTESSDRASTEAWSVEPTGTGGRSTFTMDSAPGTVIKDSVRVSNLSPAPLSMQLYGADAYNTPRDGALAYRQAGEAQTGIGTWVSLATNAMVIPPGRAADIPFTLTVPADAMPGSHIGGIVALNNAVEQAGESSGVDVGIQRAIAVRVQLTVEGPLTPGLAVQDLHMDHDPAGRPFAAARATLSYTVVNTGNTALEPTVAPRIRGLLGLRETTFPARGLPLLLPGQSTRLTVQWSPAPGVDFLSASVEVGATGVPTTSAETSQVVLAWPTVGSVAALLAVLAVCLALIRRRRRSGAGARS
ncbi:WxL protein peptidoglycan domain-containing protein [Streptomyces sp. NPDC058623]|uniref:WxL protein peptidoglycan domain-containing protein n=1 Tax=Streptomyces sp. NPDC058623 TaxID=3346563 RepID=UPI003654147F